MATCGRVLTMPELPPEVHGLCMYLDTQLHGAVLTEVRINSISALKTADPPYTALEGRAIRGAKRIGKFVCIDADGLFFVFHLAKAGWVRYTEHPSSAGLRLGKSNISARLLLHRPPADDAHIGVDLTEAGTKKSLAIYVVKDPQDVPGIATLGPEPLSPDFDLEALAAIVGSSSQQIKGLLRSQSVIAGIGNATATRFSTPRKFHLLPPLSPWTRQRWPGSMRPCRKFWWAPSTQLRASLPANSRTLSAAISGCMPGRASLALCVEIPSVRCPSRTPHFSIALHARPTGRSSPTAGPHGF